MIKLAVALPAFNSTLDVGHAAMWLGFGAALANSQTDFQLVSFANYSINGIDLARNVAVYEALEAGADALLMVDADTFHASADAAAVADAGVDLLQMTKDALRGAAPNADGILEPIQMPSNNGVGLIGAPVRGRGIGNRGVCVQGHDGSLISETALRGRIVPVGRIGAACIVVNLRWLREHWSCPAWFQMTHSYEVGQRPRNARGEDYFICDGIWSRGGAVLCDGRFVPSHVDRRKLVGENNS